MMVNHRRRWCSKKFPSVFLNSLYSSANILVINDNTLLRRYIFQQLSSGRALLLVTNKRQKKTKRTFDPSGVVISNCYFLYKRLIPSGSFYSLCWCSKKFASVFLNSLCSSANFWSQTTILFYDDVFFNSVLRVERCCW